MMHAKPECPVPFQGDLRNLPEALAPLKELPNWVCWRWEWRIDKEGVGKWTKPPLQPGNPKRHAKNNDPSTWGTYEQALTVFEAGKCDGIGFNLLGTDIAAFDIDDCRDPATGAIAPEAMAIVDRAASYTEMTPSGTGLRVVGYGFGANVHRKQTIPGSAVEVESYRGAERYIVITGNPLPGTLDVWPHMIHIGDVIDAVVAELDVRKGEARQDKADQDKAQQDLDNEFATQPHGANAGSASADPGSTGADAGDAFLPGDLIQLIEKGVPPQHDLSDAFHHAVCWLGDCGWSAERIEARITGKPIVPERYAKRLGGEIARSLFKRAKAGGGPGSNSAGTGTGTGTGAGAGAGAGPGAGSAGSGAGTAGAGGTASAQPPPLVLTAEEFVDGFTPPAYLVDGILQRGYLYSLTARTGHGKTAVTMYIAQCVARGQEMHGQTVKAGTVLLLAGENPDDIRARFLVLGDAYGFDAKKIKMRFIAGVVNLEVRMPEIRATADLIDDLVLVIVDTAAAYFPGDDTNSNSQQGAYARLLRELTFLKGKPAVLVNCHPVKNAAKENLLPMGGSAFVNEVDGNLTLWARADKQTTLHWLGKFRGPEFEPMAFELQVMGSDRVKDAEGRLMPSVVAKPMSEMAQEAGERQREYDENRVLRTLHHSPGASISAIAVKCSFVSSDGKPHKSKTQRILKQLLADKMVEQHRGAKYRITKKGKKEIGAGDSDDD